MKSKVYTRTGDKGQTSLASGERVCKNCNRIEAYGQVDELNSHIGLLASMVSDEETARQLQLIQNILFSVGGNLAMDTTTVKMPETCKVTPLMVERLEAWIDEIDANLPPIRAFILPGGTTAAAQCHVCRTICRRAERTILTLAEECEIDDELMKFVNRLSDYLFVLARKINKMATKDEILWNNPCL